MKFPECVLLIVKSGSGTMVVRSDEVSFAVFASPPPLTLAEFVTDEAALPATSAVSVIAGKLADAFSTSLLVHVNVPSVQLQPLPLSPVEVSPVGRVSVTVTVLVVGPAPPLLTRIE